MDNTPENIYKQYKASMEYKAGFTVRGMFEQNRINERFFYSDQWYGVSSPADKPLVRHNIIKRIGDYKMGVLAANDIEIGFIAEGINDTKFQRAEIQSLKDEILSNKRNSLSDLNEKQKTGLLCDVLSSYYKVHCARIGLEEKLAMVLRKSFISGTGFLYTFWETDEADGVGDIACEVLNCEDICFADNTTGDIQKQPFIIVASKRNTKDVRRQAALFNPLQKNIENITEDYNGCGKTTVFTKFYKVKNANSITVKAISVTEKCVIRPEFDTGLKKYPLNNFVWEEKDGSAFGESEITHLIPNQIAINRMITASVWAAMSMGMPIMTVNGDTVSGEITNDPGQIIKVYGTNEDVAGAVHFVTPPDFSQNFRTNIESLINNTIEASGASGVLYSLLPSNNSAAVNATTKAIDISLKNLKTRYLSFLCGVALVWLDFCVSKYGKRDICIEDKNGRWCFPFDAELCRSLKFAAKANLAEDKEENNDSKDDI